MRYGCSAAVAAGGRDQQAGDLAEVCGQQQGALHRSMQHDQQHGVQHSLWSNTQQSMQRGGDHSKRHVSHSASTQHTVLHSDQHSRGRSSSTNPATRHPPSTGPSRQQVSLQQAMQQLYGPGSMLAQQMFAVQPCCRLSVLASPAMLAHRLRQELGVTGPQQRLLQVCSQMLALLQQDLLEGGPPVQVPAELHCHHWCCVSVNV